MGFFSSRRAELSETHLQDESTVVRVIRSRFYGKGKGKERDIDDYSESNSTSSPSLSSPHTLYRGKRSFSSLKPRDPSKDPRWVGTSTAAPRARQEPSVHETSSPRSSADVLTITLAQRLNELATANSEGLLSDDEYRLLRQSLFERFASSSPVPTETPLVPIGRVVADGRTSLSSSHDRRPSSQFHVQSSRASSLQSKRSITSSVTSLLRRVTSRRVVSLPSEFTGSDAVSMFSIASNAEQNGATPRTLSSQTSESSLRMDISRTQPFRPLGLAPGDVDSGSSARSITRGRKRSGSSVPPSAFPGSAMSLDASRSNLGLLDALPNDDDLETAKELRSQIESVEAEGRRLLDTFNGLELSILTGRSRRPHIRPTIPLSISRDGSAANTSERRSLRAGKEVDSMSFTSGGSIRTTHSIRRSPSGTGRMTTVASSSTLVSQHKPVSRKGSMSSVSSRGRAGPNGLSSLTGHFGLSSSSSINLAKSSGHLPLATVAETESPSLGHRASATDDSRWPGTSGSDGLSITGSMHGGGTKGVFITDEEEIRAIEAELGDIRKRRAEVTARYDARLEYLRARLKGAELRERILRK